MDGITIQQKFRGCLLGALVGDCLGKPFEFCSLNIKLQDYFDELEANECQGAMKTYTDDTVMTINTAHALIRSPRNYKRMAKLFTKSYFSEPGHRNYGNFVRYVFEDLHETKYKDVFEPAQEQFDGKGSYGNGGAMRVAPIALYYIRDPKATADAVVKATSLTHTHPLGVNGALLQCFAIQQSFMEDKIDAERFINALVERIKEFEGDYEYKGIAKPYEAQLKSMLILLKSNTDVTTADVVKELGNDVTALRSVPTAIYCFLRAQREIPGVETDNAFRRAIQYAISLGGDTDTIACMTGAISGAYHGESIINKNVLSHCEDFEKVIKLANDLCNSKLHKNSFCTML